MPDDTTFPPPDEAVTDPHMCLPANDGAEPPPEIIPRGFAQYAFAKLLDELQELHARLEALGMAIARQLDEDAS